MVDYLEAALALQVQRRHADGSSRSQLFKLSEHVLSDADLADILDMIESDNYSGSVVARRFESKIKVLAKTPIALMNALSSLSDGRAGKEHRDDLELVAFGCYRCEEDAPWYLMLRATKQPIEAWFIRMTRSTAVVPVFRAMSSADLQHFSNERYRERFVICPGE